MHIETLSTPCLLIERSRLEANLLLMQEKADTQGVALRPHTKTHKSVDLARMQTDFGASGLTVAKVGEAEVYVRAGFEDIRIAYEVIGNEKYERIARLMDRARISFCIDTIEGARAASRYFSDQNLMAEILLEIDCGYGRCGVRWDHTSSIELFRAVSELSGLQVSGILTHAGQSYNGPDSSEETEEEALRRASLEERDRMLEFAVALSDADLVSPESGFEISIGSTPSMKYFENRSLGGFRITEIRPGNYVFHDRTQVALGVAEWRDCALTVLTTVISVHRNGDGSERLFLDAGKKVFTSDDAPGMEGFGTLLYNAREMVPLPHAQLVGFSEEHGWVRVHGGATLRVGDTVRVVPSHVCVTVNTQQQLYLVDGEDLVDTWSVDAQSKVR